MQDHFPNFEKRKKSKVAFICLHFACARKKDMVNKNTVIHIVHYFFPFFSEKLFSNAKLKCQRIQQNLEIMSKELNHLAAILHIYARPGFEFYEVTKKILLLLFQKENGNTFTLLIIFIVKSLQKEQNSTNLLL